MPGGHQHADRIRIMHHGAVGAGIQPALVRIARDAVGAGADVAPAILFMPDRGGKFRHVDGVAGEHVLQHRPGLDDFVRNDRVVLHEGFAIGVAQLPLAHAGREAEGHGAAAAGEHVQQQAETLGAAWHIVEHHAGAVFLAQDRLGGQADILLPARALHVAHFAKLLGQFQPFAQIVIGDLRRGVAACLHLLLSPCPACRPGPALSGDRAQPIMGRTRCENARRGNRAEHDRVGETGNGNRGI